jgi:hypothetical protein
MLKRLAALLTLLAFAGQALAGGFVCGQDAHKSASKMASLAKGGGGSSCEMACCVQGKSPAASPVAMVCCEVVCGEQSSGGQFETAIPPHLPAPLVAPHRIPSFDLLGAAGLAISFRSAESLLLDCDPPALFLHHSAFLI